MKMAPDQTTPNPSYSGGETDTRKMREAVTRCSSPQRNLIR